MSSDYYVSQPETVDGEQFVIFTVALEQCRKPGYVPKPG